MADLIFVRVHAMPCVNRCWHCFCNGSPEGDFMDEEVILRVLVKLVELREKTGIKVFPMFYDEPTLHPDFLNIMRHQLEQDLIFDQWWFSTNGFGLARMSDDDWTALADMGFSGIRLTFHGIGEEHDRFAGRKGAYDDLISTIRRAEEFDIDWFAGMILNAENVSSYQETKATIEGMGTPSTKFGWMLPQSQGRAADNENRVTIQQVSHLVTGSKGWRTERNLVEDILSSEELSNRRALDPRCGIVYLDVDEDLNVFYGGGCDGDPFHVDRSQVLLGNMNDCSIHSCYEQYVHNQPMPVRLLSEVTWRELAEKFGDPDNEQVFHVTDLVGRKWSEAYLRECSK